jgi:hypothetical protein
MSALDLITGALRKINVLASGEVPSAAETADALVVLNDLLDTWSTEHLSVYNNAENIIVLTPGKSSYTVGPGGDFNIVRPLRITNAYTRLSTSGTTGIDYFCDIWTIDEYSQIGLKGQPGPWPKALYYNTGYPLSTLILWPVPTMGGEFHMWTDAVFTTFANATDAVNLPQGYSRALKLSLALELAPEYGVQVPPLLLEQARKAKEAIKALNATPQATANYDRAIVATGRGDAGWILHGGFQ